MHLNHASYGVPSFRLLDLVERTRRQLEGDASTALGAPLRARLRECADVLRGFLGARDGELALVANATEASAAVTSSLVRAGARRVVLLDTEYESVIRGWRLAADVTTVPLPLPARDPLAVLEQAVQEPFDVLVVSLVASSTALRLPVARLAAWARSRGARTVVDAAHGPGHVDVAIGELDADAVFGTLHKWLPVPRPAGFLWVAPGLADAVRPAVPSLLWDEPFADRFGWRGTWDPSNVLRLADALDEWREWRDAGRLAGAERLADAVSAALPGLAPTGTRDLLAPRLRAFVVPGVPLERLRSALDAAGVRAWTGPSATGETVLRVATHVWTTDDDLDRLAAAVRAAGVRQG